MNNLFLINLAIIPKNDEKEIILNQSQIMKKNAIELELFYMLLLVYITIIIILLIAWHRYLIGDISSYNLFKWVGTLVYCFSLGLLIWMDKIHNQIKDRIEIIINNSENRKTIKDIYPNIKTRIQKYGWFIVFGFSSNKYDTNIVQSIIQILNNGSIPYRYMNKNDNIKLIHLGYFEGLVVTYNNNNASILFRNLTFYPRYNGKLGISFETGLFNFLFSRVDSGNLGYVVDRSKNPPLLSISPKTSKGG